MSDTPSNLWQQAWYPVAYLRDLDPQAPQRFVLLGQPLVIWFERGEDISTISGSHELDNPACLNSDCVAS